MGRLRVAIARLQRISLRISLRRAARWSALGCGLLVVAWLAVDLTPARWWIDEARFARPADAFDVVDRDGAVLRHARVDGIDRRWAPLGAIDPMLIDAFIAAEDRRFRSHRGVDGRALVRGAMTSLRPWGRRSGGSTITQQLVKLVYGRPNGLLSKPLEMLRARALERLYTKDRILEEYLNRVPFGDRIQGVERAAEEYFGHPAADVSLAEAALLAGIPQAPSANEPRRHFARTRRRAGYVLDRMVATGAITEEARAHALDGPFIRDIPPRPDQAPRLVDRVLEGARAGLVDRPGHHLATSIDLALQREVDRLLRETVQRFEARGMTNAAGIVVANASGEVLAYTGAARRNGPGGSLDLLSYRRQPGSTLKPFAYELFFERGGTAATVLDDISLPRTGALGAWFEARDYDGRERGPTRARIALAASLNLAALDVAARVGQDRLVERFRALGLRDVGAASRYGGAAVLGGLDVAPADLAAAYVALARGGTRVPLSRLKKGSRESAPIQGERVMNAAACAVAREILADPRARAEAFGDDLVRHAGGESFALKTGTSSGFRDAWAAVFDETFTVVVWTGDPAGRPLDGVSGFAAAAPAAATILGAARRRAPDIFPDASRPPEASSSTVRADHQRLVSASVCAQTGLRAGSDCAHAIAERFAEGTVPEQMCEAHDERGDVVLASRYAAWVARHHPSGVARTFVEPAAADEVLIREPRDGARFLVDASGPATSLPLRARVGTVDVIGREVRWRIDGLPVDGEAWTMRAGDHEVVAEWRGKKSRPVTVRVESAASR